MCRINREEPPFPEFIEEERRRPCLSELDQKCERVVKAMFLFGTFLAAATALMAFSTYLYANLKHESAGEKAQIVIFTGAGLSGLLLAPYLIQRIYRACVPYFANQPEEIEALDIEDQHGYGAIELRERIEGR